MDINTSIKMEFSDDGDKVFFIVDIFELFGVDLDHPGILGALLTAFHGSRDKIPKDTGLMRSSYTMRRINKNRVEIFFDYDKIVGRYRKGRQVKEYYPKYLKEKSKTFNWLDIVIREFFRILISEIRQINREREREEKIRMGSVLLFYKYMNQVLRDKIKEEENKNAK